jgi:zinc-ribbon domain
MARFCPNCGTEVDDNASFCPTCGQPLDEPLTAPEAPRPSGGWVEPGEPTIPAQQPPPVAYADEPTRAAPRVEPPPGPTAAPPPRAAERRTTVPSTPRLNLPITWPVTLSGWLIGAGALLGALAMFLPWFSSGFVAFGGFDSFVNIVLLILLLAVAAWVFLSTVMPQFRHQRLAILAVLLVGLGVALDRLGLGGFGIGVVLFFIAMAGAVIGAVVLELGMDRPVGVPVGRPAAGRPTAQPPAAPPPEDAPPGGPTR